MTVDDGNQHRSGATGIVQQADMGPRFRFSLALPLGQLLLSAALIVIFCGPGSLFPVRTGTIYVEANVAATDHHSDGRYLEDKSPSGKDNSQPGARAQESPDRQMRITGQVLASVWLLNLPGSILRMEAARYTSNHEAWIARAVGGFTTSLLSGALLGLPFWWIACRGADALLALRRNIIAPRIHFPETAIAFALVVGAVLLVLTGLLMFLTEGETPASPLITIFLLLWYFLGSITVYARYKQRRTMQAAVRS